MRTAIFLCLTLLTCPFLLLIAPTTMPTPTIAPTAAIPDPHVEISAERTSLRVGDTVTITGVPVNIGLPIYTLKLSSGASAHVRYDNLEQTVVSDDAQFEIIAMHGSMNEVTFTLRTKAAGTAEVTISASGEIREPSTGGFMWSGGVSPGLTITVNP